MTIYQKSARIAVTLTVALLTSACSAASPETVAASAPTQQLAVTVQAEGEGASLGSYEFEAQLGAVILYHAIAYIVENEDDEAAGLLLRLLDEAIQKDRALLYPVVYRPLLETLWEVRDAVRADPSGVYKRLLPQVQEKIWAIIKETT